MFESFLILHADCPRNLVDYVQESGRAGRDGLFSEAIIISTNNWNLGLEDADDEEKSMVLRLMDIRHIDRRCRREVLNEYMDGDMGRVICAQGEAACDICCTSTDKSIKQYTGAVAPMSSSPKVVTIDVPASSLASVTQQHPAPRAAHTANPSASSETATAAAAPGIGPPAASNHSVSTPIHVDNSPDGPDTNDALALAAYTSQQQLMSHARRRVNHQRVRELWEIDELRRILPRWQGPCALCFLKGRDD